MTLSHPSQAELTSSSPVTAVIATIGGRPELLRIAIESILGQKDASGAPWPVQVLVMFDHVDVQDLSEIQVPAGSSLLGLNNQRSKGLAGGRNSGIDAAEHPIVGFCDDDDAWLPGKLAKQVPLLARSQRAKAVAGGLVLRTGGQDVVRTAPEWVSFQDLLRSRVQEVHPSAVMYRTADLRGELGLVDEDLPHGYGEDYDMLLRAAKLGGIVCVPEPVVAVLWDRPSYFTGKWIALAEGLGYMLQKFPEFESEPKGLSRMAGQIAFAHAALGDGREARRWARSALKRDAKQLRAWAALLVTTRLVPADRLLKAVQRTGRGL